ncbi:T9SS type A sorting domain-containing protein [Membranihabitans maritimus]|uniref:T9SS type A sorting domain-containing protein n=1 Tax=Membranihabitans maritimus TaxID=2904244 RepID=UPI001F3164D5|nr:T9SS type A sorting domain-containing protein [Membranihabitans maritimus]
MNKIIINTSLLAFIIFFQSDLKAQCTVGDLNAQNLGYSPSTLYSCRQVTVTAEWLLQGQIDFDSDFHQSTLIVSLPSEFLGTTGNLAVTATNGNTYWNAGNISFENHEVQVPLEGIIPEGITISIVISDMDMVTTDPFATVNITQSVSNVVSDCDPGNDEQSITAFVIQTDAPLITNIQPECINNELGINLSVEPGENNGGNIESYSWSGPNGFTSSIEDPSIIISSGEETIYSGEYIVSVSDDNGCISQDTIVLNGQICSALPIAIKSFTATSSNCSTKLLWTTAQEINNSHFRIQRSSNGSNFETIGTVDGGGTSTSKREYSFEDQNVTGGKYFYRLQQIDFDGDKSYSSVEEVTIACGDAGKGLLYPNPVNSILYIKQSNTDVQTVELYNIVGQLVLHKAINEVNYISVENLSQGTYYAIAKDKNNRMIVSKKLIKISD